MKAWRLEPPGERLRKGKRYEGTGRTWRTETPDDEPLRVRLTRFSQNVKTGPIPVSTSSPSTCPPSCMWYGKGCYAEHHYIGFRWRKTAETGMAWEAFLAEVRKFPPGQLWRHNEAGDLPGRGEHLDGLLLARLVLANKGRRGFTYCHKKQIDFYETRAREVIVYFRALPANAKKEIAVDLVANVPGTYTAPASSSYLYYTAENKTWAKISFTWA